MSYRKIKLIKDDSIRLHRFDWDYTPPELTFIREFKAGDVLTISDKTLSETKHSITTWLYSRQTKEENEDFVEIILKKKNFVFLN